MKRLFNLGICCLLLTFYSCQTDNPITEGAKESPTITERSCNTQQHMEDKLSDPVFRAFYEESLAKEKESGINHRELCAEPRVLPVAIHYQGLGANATPECLRTLAVNQISQLNADFQALNSDFSNWTNNAASTFPNINYGETCVLFCIADKNHPEGYNLNDGDLAVTINQTSGDQLNDWSGYINIFVRDIGGGILGYASLPGFGNGDGVVITRTAFGAGSGCGGVTPTAPFDRGRTLTHEIGHYMNLRHIWGDGGCGASDFVDDTPDASASNSGCPNIGKQSCQSADLHMNFMDYTNDACMYMFTAGQVERMESSIQNRLQNVLGNAAIVCSVAPEPTCSDNIRNQGETGIDCGGPCDDCGQTCDNGLKDGDETGVDCGGSCPNACPTSGGNCPITGRYATFATANANDVRAIAAMISELNDPQVNALVTKVIANQDEAMELITALHSNPQAARIMNSLISTYQDASTNGTRLDKAAVSVELVEYFNLAKAQVAPNSALNSILDEAIELAR